jgi:uncharacterized protein YdeI (YjbR/CyaY-like superfamily)
VPAELRQALDADPVAAEAFESLSPSHRKEFADWVASGRKEETRQSRAAKAVPMVLARKHVR